MKKFLITILTILIIGLAGVSIYYAFINKEDSKEEKKEKTTVIDDSPKEDEPYENETTIKSKYVDEEDAKDVELKYDQYITASGYAGASDNVYYTRNGVLYHLIVSTEETIKLAEGVEKIESDLDNMRAYKTKDFKLIREDDYVVYVD